jgi:excisionase family DNA binding protein
MLTPEEVARRLGVRASTVLRWLRTGHLGGMKIGGRAGWRIPQEEVQRFIWEMYRPPRTGAQHLEQRPHVQVTRVEPLRQHLDGIPSGPVAGEDWEKLLPLLKRSWYDFEGATEEGMAASKLDRAEDVVWEPPYLYLTVERHGGVTYGGKRAELHRWCVDLEAQTARIVHRGYRYISPPEPRWDPRPAAHEIAEAVVQGRDDDRIDWRKDRQAFRVLTSKVIPGRYRRTLEGRRARFYAELKRLVGPHGWRREYTWWVRK